MDHKFEQIVRVESNETDGDDSGRHWTVHYVLYDTVDDDGRQVFALYTDDGEGNGVEICRGFNLGSMRSLTLRLGEFVEWRETKLIYDHEGAAEMAKALGGVPTMQSYFD